LIDANNRLKVDASSISTHVNVESDVVKKKHSVNANPEYHTLPIPFPNDRTVTIEYPKKLTTKDIRIIVKALDFVANTSIISENDDTEIEIEISIKETKKGITV